MRRLHLLCILAFIAGCVDAQPVSRAPSRAAEAQFSFLADREAIIALAGKWRFQPGDDPAFAAPSFDDSQWKLLDSGRPWSDQGYPGMSGLAWYRFRVTLPAGNEAMALYLPIIGTCYQVFADGTLLVTVGRMPPHSATFRSFPTLVPLPSGSRTGPKTVTIALRVWHNPIWARYVGGGPQGEPQLGASDRMTSLARGSVSVRAWRNSMDLTLALIELLAAMISAALFALRRSEQEYLWFAIASLGASASYFLYFYSSTFTNYVHVTDGTGAAISAVSGIAILLFYRTLLKGNFSGLFWLAVACGVISYVDLWLLFTGHLITSQVNASSAVLVLPSFFYVLLLLLKRLREKLPDARLLLFPLLLSTITHSLSAINNSLTTLGQKGLPFSLEVLHAPIRIAYEDLAELLFLLAMLAILIARFARTSREQDRAASEFEAARSLQHVLIPEELPPIPGLAIATSYLPAQEVGGDFFQVIPLSTGAALIILGDVSGKGVRAAMTVSVLIGALRTLAEITSSPALVLAGLNRRLHGRVAGFTTCIVLSVDVDHTLTVANAGHLAPYLNGVEMEMEGSLPLGVLEDAEFPERSMSLAAGDRLTLLTDGVPEATRRSELFGFVRTQGLASQSASTIAEAARAFGQSDDITVLTIDLAPQV